MKRRSTGLRLQRVMHAVNLTLRPTLWPLRQKPGEGGSLMTRLYSRLLVLALLLAPAGAWAGKLTCLTGTDPSVAGDLSQIQAVRASINGACLCANFDGSPGKTHSNYVKCANGVITTSVAASKLRKQCTGTVTKYYSVSTCGFPASQDKEPCLKKSAAGKVTCAVKPTAKCTGTACANATLCIDAADSNGDGLIGAGDSGACVLAPTPTPTTNMPTPTATSPSAPPPPQACGNSAPACGGACPANEFCAPFIGGSCVCFTPCNGLVGPACTNPPDSSFAEACPSGQVCTSNGQNGVGACSCQPQCSATAPACGGSCAGQTEGVGKQYGACVPFPGGGCGCTIACGGVVLPSCAGGSCDPGFHCGNEGLGVCSCIPNN